MKTEYKSDLKKNYLVVEPEEEVNSEDYDVRMMEQNQIQGFLPMQVRRLDGSCYLYYEITSMQQVDLVYGKRQLQNDDIRHIFSGVKDILESARKYLLRPGQILLDPQYMYMEMQTGKICICYLPVKESSFSVLPLAEFILKKLNHEDPDAVSLGYDFYQKATQPNFSLSDTLHEMLAGAYRRGQENGSTSACGKEEYRKEGYGREGYEERGYRETGHEKAGSGTGYREEEIHGAVRGNSGEQDFYEVHHKERKRAESGKKNDEKKNRVFQAVHPAILILTVLLSAVLGILLYFQWLGFTETGGLFFILLSVSILLNRFWKNRVKRKQENESKKRGGRKKKTQVQEWEDVPFEEDSYMEEMQRLREELYGPEKKDGMQAKNEYERDRMPPMKTGYEEEERLQVKHRYMENGKPKAEQEIQEKKWAIQERNSICGERTQCLGDMEKFSGLCLVSEQPEKYPKIFIREKILIVGKKRNQADIILDEAAVSRIHARLEYHQGGYYIMDLDSRNGTYLNGLKLLPREQVRIRNGDRVAFANISYRAVAEDESEMTQLLR